MSDTRPNLLLVILDTLRRDRLQIYGNPRPTSPYFDQFADDHLLFTRAVAPAQWTIPAHASMFTGVYPARHGVTQSNSALSGALPALAEILTAAGYHTAAFCNNPLVGVLDNGLQRGFADFFNYASAIPNRPYGLPESRAKHAFLRWFRPHARRIGNQFAKSDELFRIALNPLFVPIWSKYIRFKGSTAESISDLISFWRAYHDGGRERPLFTFVNLMGAHTPYHPPRDMLERIAPEINRDKRAFAFMRQFNADGAAWASPRETPLEDWQMETIDAFYQAEIAAQDEQLGKLLYFLKQTGALDNTVVVIAADHGEMHGEHDYFGHGFSVHQPLVHVPMAMHLPDAPRAEITAAISTRRLFHTFLELAGAETPLDLADPNADVLGLSLMNEIARGVTADGGTPLSEAVPPMTFLNVLKHRAPAMIDRLALVETRRTVYDGDHKLIMRADQVEALYAVERDPDETHNLAGDPDQAARIEALKRKIAPLIGAVAENGESGELSAQVIEQLRSLGYMD